MGMIMLCMNGVYNPLKIAWEAIPFSWLIEWFTNKRTQLLKELASLSPFPDAQILGMGHTIKVKVTLGLVQAWKKELTAPPYPATSMHVGDFLYERFDRRPGLPTGESALFDATRLDLRQASIMGGIAVNWRRRRK
jgi:hypothetical protein